MSASANAISLSLVSHTKVCITNMDFTLRSQGRTHFTG